MLTTLLSTVPSWPRPVWLVTATVIITIMLSAGGILYYKVAPHINTT